MSRPNLTFFQRVDRLRSLPARLRVAALADALLGCTPEEADTLAPALLEMAVVPLFERPNGEVPWISRVHRLLHRISGDQSISLSALRGIARAYARLSEDHRAAARAVGCDRWALVSRPLVTDTLPTARRSLALLACETADADLIALLPSLLHDPDGQVARQAELGLVHAATAPGEGATRPSEALLAALAEALGSFAVHRRRGPLLASIHALDRRTVHRAALASALAAANLVETLARIPDDTAAALRTTLQSDRDPASRLRAWEWLPRGAFAGACVKRLVRAEAPREHEPLLAASHLIAHPARAAAWAAARPALDLPGPDAAADLSRGARRGLPRLATCRGSPRLAWLVVDPDPQTRFAAVTALPAAELRDFAFDPDARVAATAAARLLWADPDEPASAAAGRTRRLLSRSPHPGVRALANALSEEPASRSARGRVRERRAAAADPARWRSRIIERLRSTESDVVVHAAGMLRSLAATQSFGAEILAACRPLASAASGSSAARALATLVSALGDTNLREHAAAYLDHADPRVRANAVEALSRRTTVIHPALIELKPDVHHRARANMLRVRIRQEPARSGSQLPQLISMLEDADPAHRLAGAWLASRVPVHAAQLRPVLGRLANSDADERVRRRAAFARERWSVTA